MCYRSNVATLKNDVSGVYKIVNKINGHHYVGSSQNVYKRWGDHKRDLFNKSHHSRYLQRAWNKYGENAFIFRLVIVCEIDSLLEYEQKILDKQPCEYNISRYADAPRGIVITEETRNKLIRSHLGQEPWNKGMSMPEETKEKLRRSYEGKQSEDFYWYGKNHSAESIEKMSEAKMGKILSQKHKQKISNSLKGHKRSAETRERMSKAQRGENSHVSVLTKEQVLFVRKMAKEAEFKRGDKIAFCKFWASKFGVRWNTIKSVINGYTWKHLL